MRHDLGMTVKMGTGSIDFYVDGSDLLEWIKNESLILERTGSQPSQAGTLGAPWKLENFQDWVNAWVTLQSPAWRQKECYFSIAGRIIKKFANRNAGGHADGLYMADNALSGKDSNQGNIWTRSTGASYREFGRHMHASMSASTKHANTTAGHIEWSKAKAKKLRAVLDGTSKSMSAKGMDSVSGALPLLGAVMFVAEPARNPRSFIVGLMLLDMIGERYSSRSETVYPKGAYILDRVLAHPERIPKNVGGSTPLAKKQKGPFPHDRRKSGYGHGYTKVKELVGVEGKWSASPAGSSRTGTDIDIANDYIQAKEVSLVSRWLARTLDIEGVTFRALKTGAPKTTMHNIITANPSTLANKYPGKLSPQARQIVATCFRDFKMLVPMRIKQFIKDRANCFSPM